jgi:endogenous inhibitor of DNA gyrase (YacG/DUF329 family)
MSAKTRPCQACWREFTPVSRTNLYCSNRCRKHAWEQRKHHENATAATEVRPAAPEPAATRACPHCGEPITIVALLTTPQAARPRTPRRRHNRSAAVPHLLN